MTKDEERKMHANIDKNCEKGFRINCKKPIDFSEEE